jgi:hypothetical protein
MQRSVVSRVIVFAGAMLAMTGAANAAQRTFVASTGSDAYPCSLAQPCRTFGQAILNTNNGGDIVVLDSAGYGAFVIDKPVSIIVPSGTYAGISVSAANVDGVVVNAPGGNVSLRGLIISSQGGMNGVRIQQANKVMIEDVKITGFWNSGNGKAILHNATNAYSTLLLRNVVLRDGDSGLIVDGTAGQKSVTVANSMIEGYSTCVAQTDDANITVQETTIADCGTGFAVNQTAAEIGYAWLALDRVTIHRSYQGGAVKIINNATNRSPTISISDSKILRTNGINSTNGAVISVARSTIDGCGPAACIDASGSTGFVNLEVTKTEIKHGPSGIRLALDAAMGGIVNLTDSRVTQIYPNEAVYVRATNAGVQLDATRSTINSNHRGIVADSHSNVKLMGNQIAWNGAGGLYKAAGAVGAFIESIGNNYVNSNGWEAGSPPDEIPATVPLR